MQAQTNKKETKITPIAHLLYSVMLVSLWLLIVGFIYGTFTDGLPPAYTYVLILASIYDFFDQCRLGYLLLWVDTKLFRFGLNLAVQYLHKKPALVWLSAALIVAFIGEIAYYHQTL